MVTVNGAGRASLVRWGRRFADHLGSRRARGGAGWHGAPADAPVTIIEPAPTQRMHRRNTDRRPQAAFIAQLLAERLDMPQSRVNRRAGVDEAEASYQAADPAARGTGRGAIVRRDI